MSNALKADTSQKTWHRASGSCKIKRGREKKFFFFRTEKQKNKDVTRKARLHIFLKGYPSLLLLRIFFFSPFIFKPIQKIFFFLGKSVLLRKPVKATLPRKFWCSNE